MKYKFIGPVANVIDFVSRCFSYILFRLYYNSRLGYCGRNVEIGKSLAHSSLSRMFLYDNTNIAKGWMFISWTGTFTMKKNSAAAQGLTIITGAHGRTVGVSFKDGISHRSHDSEKDIVVEEDVWIGANVTICSGVIIGRGATIGAGSVLRNSIPAYSIVVGNPARIIGFNFTPEEVVEHEKQLYREEDRMPLATIEKNYNKYFLNRLNDIKTFRKL